MTHRGRVKNGVVVLDDPSALPEGTEVSVRPVKGRSKGGRNHANGREPTMYERYKRFIGVVKDLPPDASTNHDHYLYGVPKQK